MYCPAVRTPASLLFSSADTDRETTLLRLPRPVIAVALVLCFVVGACGNSTKSMTASSSAPTADTAKPTDGGEAHKDEHVSLNVPGVTDKEINYSVIATKTGNILGTCLLDCYVD